MPTPDEEFQALMAAPISGSPAVPATEEPSMWDTIKAALARSVVPAGDYVPTLLGRNVKKDKEALDANPKTAFAASLAGSIPAYLAAGAAGGPLGVAGLLTAQNIYEGGGRAGVNEGLEAHINGAIEHAKENPISTGISYGIPFAGKYAAPAIGRGLSNLGKGAVNAADTTLGRRVLGRTVGETVNAKGLDAVRQYGADARAYSLDEPHGVLDRLRGISPARITKNADRLLPEAGQAVESAHEPFQNATTPGHSGKFGDLNVNLTPAIDALRKGELDILKAKLPASVERAAPLKAYRGFVANQSKGHNPMSQIRDAISQEGQVFKYNRNWKQAPEWGKQEAGETLWQGLKDSLTKHLENAKGWEKPGGGVIGDEDLSRIGQVNRKYHVLKKALTENAGRADQDTHAPTVVNALKDLARGHYQGGQHAAGKAAQAAGNSLQNIGSGANSISAAAIHGMRSSHPRTHEPGSDEAAELDRLIKEAYPDK